MIRVIQRRLIIPRGDTGIFTIPAMTQAEGAIGVFTIFDPITNTRIFQKQVEIEGENFNISFSHADTVNLKAGEYLWDIKFYKNPILADNKVIDGEEINSYYAAFQAPKCEIRETGDDFLMIEGQPAKIEDLNIILAATEAANAAKVAATEKAEEAAARLAEMIAAIPTKVSELENDSGYLQEETDPTVPAWAKAQTKPTYTAQEVGALPADTVIPTVPTNVSAFTNDAGYLTAHQDISMKANSADLAAVATSGSYNDLSDKPTIPEVPVQDVQVNGASVLDANGVANIPTASGSVAGVMKVGAGLGVDGSFVVIYKASNKQIKNGAGEYAPIVAAVQDRSAFYGLAKAAGDTTQSASSNTVGAYTESAKSAISEMLSGSVSVSGTTPTINALPGVRYVCGEVSTLDVTVPASGIIDVVFTSGSTPTVLTVTPPTGMTMKWANGFDPTALETNTVYEINVMDGCLGVAGTWT